MTDRNYGLWHEPKIETLQFKVRNEPERHLEPPIPIRQSVIQLPAGQVTHWFPDFEKLSKRAYRRQRGKMKGRKP